MIVCVCNNVSDRKIRQAVETGVTTMVELRDRLDVGTCCGKCHACAKRVLRESIEELNNNTQPLLFQANAMAA